jgi:Lrp/AsnC family transcriptional regulator, leucine-responsive regulatory protein
LDEVDAKILKALLKDARTSLKDMAEDCGLSSNAIYKRIANLKASGVIVGTTVFFTSRFFGGKLAVSMEITVDASKKDRIVRFVREYPGVTICIEGIGRCDILAFAEVAGVDEMENVKETINKQPGVKSVTTSVQVEDVQFDFDSLNLGDDATNG